MQNLKSRYLLLLSLILFLFSFNTSAQNGGIGVKAGLSSSILNGQIYNGRPGKGASYKVGPHFGLYGYFRPSNQFAIQPEVIYSVQGCKNEWAYGKTTTTLHYVNIPLMFKLYIGNKFFWQVGPQLGLLASAQEKGTVSGYATSQQDVAIDKNTTTSYTETDFSLATGFGINFTPKITFSARFNYGLGNIDDTSANKNFRKNNPLNNRVFQFSIGYNFGGDNQPDSSRKEE